MPKHTSPISVLKDHEQLSVPDFAPKSAMQPRLDYIDGLRALAVLSVLAFHATIWSGAPKSWHLNFLQLGRSGVDLFMVLSGFCLFRPMLATATELKPLNLLAYAKRRVGRIYPPYLAALVLCCVCSFLMYESHVVSWWNFQQPFQTFFPWRGWWSIGDIGSHLLLIHGFFPQYCHSLDGAFWSLSLEWQFYILLPILVLVGRRYSIAVAIAIPIAVTILYRVCLKALYPAALGTYVGDELCFARWSQFGAGMMAAFVVRRGFVRHKGNLLLLGMLPVALFLELTRPSFFLLPVLYGFGYAALVIESETGLLHNIFENKYLVEVGKMSYSLYLVHGSIYMVLAQLVSSFDEGTRAKTILIAGPIVCVGLGYLFHLAFERPTMISKRQKL